MVDSPAPDHIRFRWVIYAFVVAFFILMAVLIWQLGDLSPARWCVMAKQGSPALAASCVTMLVGLLNVKDHAVIGLMFIVGLSVVALAAVALRLKIGVGGPGGLSANVEADTTTVTDGSSTVAVETPSKEN